MKTFKEFVKDSKIIKITTPHDHDSYLHNKFLEKEKQLGKNKRDKKIKDSIYRDIKRFDEKGLFNQIPDNNKEIKN